MSSQWNSGMLRIINTTRSPGCTPNERNPAAARAALWPISAKVRESNAPSGSIQRMAVRSPYLVTVSTNPRATVVPSTIASMSALVTEPMGRLLVCCPKRQG